MSGAYHGASGLLMTAILNISNKGDQCKESNKNAISEQPELSANAVLIQ